MSAPTLKCRLEVNFCRLLNKCESMAANNQTSEWRFEKFVSALEDKLLELKKLNVCQPSKDTFADYTKKVEFMKSLLMTEHLPTLSEKAVASQLLSTGTLSLGGQGRMKEIQIQTQARYSKAVREELLGSSTSGSGGDGVRHRAGSNAGTGASEDLDTLLQHHHSMQEKYAEEMVALVQNMKQNSLLAGRIIRKDIRTIEGSAQLAERNVGNLKQESERLESHVQRACKWWIWILLALACMTFLWMIVFIRLFPKRIVYTT